MTQGTLTRDMDGTRKLFDTHRIKFTDEGTWAASDKREPIFTADKDSWKSMREKYNLSEICDIPPKGAMPVDFDIGPYTVYIPYQNNLYIGHAELLPATGSSDISLVVTENRDRALRTSKEEAEKIREMVSYITMGAATVAPVVKT